MGTWDHLSINLMMGALPGLLGAGILSAIMSIPFLITRSILDRRKITRWRHLWLCGPSLGIATFIAATTLWISLPSQRLKLVAQDELPGATRIRVTGFSGFNGSDFVAVCNLDESAFLSWCQRQNLAPENKIDVQDNLKHRSRIRAAKLVTSLPPFKDPLEFSRVEGTRQNQGVFTMYDRRTSTMVIHRFFHD